MKKVMVCGCGAQGSTICRKLDEEPNIVEVVCADYNFEAAQAVCKLMKKGTPKQVDASNVDEIVAAAEGCELIVNVMPLEMGINVMRAAIKAKCCYQDLSACLGLVESPDPWDSWRDGIKFMYDVYGAEFAKNNTTAIIGTGSAPGVMCAVARRAVRELDECDTIACMVYEGCKPKRFLPFWWSTRVAMEDMSIPAFAYENGEQIRTPVFGRPIKRTWPEMGNKEVTLVEHAHDEPVYIGFNAEKYFKGCKNAYFKYGGAGCDFAHPLVEANLLGMDPNTEEFFCDETFNGVTFNPFEFVLSHIPPAPKDPDVIKEIIDEGLVSDDGAFVCEAYGKKDGKDVMVDLHLSAPGLVDSYEKAKLSAEMYLTGQGAFLFTKLFVNDMMPQKGLFSSDMLDDDQVDQYLKWAEELDITYTMEIKEGVTWNEE